jgi:alanine dehydrogenase
LLLSRSDLEGLLDVQACLLALEQGFITRGSHVRPQRIRTDLPVPGTATALLPGLLEGVPAYTVKINAKFPAARPALRGVVCLHALSDGELLALLDSATVTAWRTGLSAALASHVLARPDASTVTVIGTGAQADLVLRGLALFRSFRNLVVNDLDLNRAATFAERHRADWPGAGWEITPDVAVAASVAAAGVIVLATWSREPLLYPGDVSPGTHITSLGTDEPGKAELAPELLRGSRVIVDDVALAVAVGALGGTELTTLAKVLGTKAQGRQHEQQITVYAPVGLPWQDLAIAWLAYRRAMERGAGVAFEFLN